MPITATLRVNTKFVDAFSDLSGEFTELIEEAGRDVLEPVIPRMLDDLREYPGPPNYPIKWKSARQRRKVMSILRRMAIERGDFVIGPRGGVVVTDLRYQRTFRLRDGWQSEIITRDGGVVLKVGNPALSVQFVMGTLNFRSLNEARRPQQPFHADRWSLAGEIVRRWFLVAEKQMLDLVRVGFGEMVEVEVRRRSRIR